MQKFAAYRAGFNNGMRKAADLSVATGLLVDDITPIVLHEGINIPAAVVGSTVVPAIGSMFGAHYGRKQYQRGERYTFGPGRAALALLPIPGYRSYQFGRAMGYSGEHVGSGDLAERVRRKKEKDKENMQSKSASAGDNQPGPKPHAPNTTFKRPPVQPSVIGPGILGTKFLSQQNSLAKSVASKAMSLYARQGRK